MARKGKVKKFWVNVAHTVNWGALLGQIAMAAANGDPVTWQNVVLWGAQATLGAALPSAGGVGHRAVFGTPQTPEND